MEHVNVREVPGLPTRHLHRPLTEIHGSHPGAQQSHRIAPTTGATAHVQYPTSVEKLGGQLHIGQPVSDERRRDAEVTGILEMTVLEIEGTPCVALSSCQDPKGAHAPSA